MRAPEVRREDGWRIRSNVCHKEAPLISAGLSAGAGEQFVETQATFLVDTGSAFTILSPTVTKRLNVNTSGGKTSSVLSLDGSVRVECVKIPVTISFYIKSSESKGSGQTAKKDESLLIKTEVLGVVDSMCKWGERYSVLGRDLLSHFKLELHPPKKDEKEWKLWLNVVSDPKVRNKFTRVEIS